MTAALAQAFLLPSSANPAITPPPTVIYNVTSPELLNHKLRIEAEFPIEAFEGGEMTLALPVWTPGSYKVRDYSKSITEIELIGAPNARLEKTAKNRWTVRGELPPGQPVKVAYTVYGRELTVRTNFFTPELSLVVGAATFLTPAPIDGDEEAIYQVRFPDLTKPVSSGLGRLESESVPTFVAESYDQLVDSPLLFGDITIHPFQAGGLPHTLVQAGDQRYWNLPDSLRDATKVVETVQKFWGETPYQDYHILNLIAEARGGLEHLNSTVLMTSRFATSDRDKYIEWLSLVCHEHFHAWNVKRLRPKALGPFDYEQEVLTPSLWVAEGVTSYYDDLLVRRAGLSTRAEYLKALSGQLNTLMSTPGRLQRPLTEASLDAWIRLYQPTDNTINDDVSYYNKGAVVAWLLDTEIRKQTNGAKTLDHVMREAYRQYSKTGFEEAEFRALVEKVSGVKLGAFFTKSLDSTEELDFTSALEYWGLEWKPDDEKVAKEPYLGVNTNSSDQRLVDSVLAGGPAAQSGISPGDELLAIDGVRIPAAGPSAVLKFLKADQSTKVLLSRQGRILEKTVTLAAQPAPKRTLKVREGAGAQPGRLDAWLGPEIAKPKKATT